MPSIIGTAVPHDHTGKRLAVSIGAQVIEDGGLPRQRIDIPAARFQSAGAARVWTYAERGTRTSLMLPAIDEVFRRPGEPAFLRSVEINPRTLLAFSPVTRQTGAVADVSDLSDDWESRGYLTLRAGTASLTVTPDDTMASYVRWNEPAETIGAFHDTLTGASGSTALTVELGLNAEPPERSYAFSRALDRVFSGHPAWGGGNVGAQAFDFVHEGARFRVYQVLPFDGPAVGGVLGACRIHIRNRDKGRGQNTLEEMPARLTLSAEGADTADWTGLPWSFTRTTNPAQFTNAGSGGTARKQVTYIADRASVGASPAAVGIARPESFTTTLYY